MVIIIIILAVVCSFLLDTVVCSRFFFSYNLSFLSMNGLWPNSFGCHAHQEKRSFFWIYSAFSCSFHTFLLFHSSTLLMIRITFFVMFSFWKKTSFVLFKVPIMNKIESLVIVVVLRHHDSTHNDRCFLHNGTFSM